MQQQDAAHLEHGMRVGLHGVPERTISSDSTPSMCALS